MNLVMQSNNLNIVSRSFLRDNNSSLFLNYIKIKKYILLPLKVTEEENINTILNWSKKFRNLFCQDATFTEAGT